jgi:serine phosphatase RsbU (regulator of sigma subunit)/integral membrane sensor domain MASE1
MGQLVGRMIHERSQGRLLNKGFTKHPAQTSRTAAYLIKLVAVLAAYFVVGVVGLAVPFTSGNVSPVWPASGIALGAILLLGYRIWPAIALAAFLVNLPAPISPVAALGIAVGNTIGPLIGARLLGRFTSFQPSLTHLRDVLALIVVAALGGTAISATIGCLTLSLTPVNPWLSFGTAWLIWYLGDAMGVLIVTPLLLTFAGLRSIREPREILNFAAMVLGTVISCLLIFDRRFGFHTGEGLFAFAVFPFVIWGAIRFQASGAAAISFLISVIVVVETAYGFGPFAKSDPLQNATLLQCFLAVISISGMTLAAVNSERVQVMRQQVARERVEGERLAALEMGIACEVQSKLLPQRTPPLPTLDYAARCVQARAVGGDYYDYLDLGSNRIALVLADISGKGISAALLMANLQAALRSQSALLVENFAHSLRLVNRLFFECTEPSKYATLFVGIYDDTTRSLRYVNCGHNPPLLLRGPTIERLVANVTVLGLFEEWECVVAETTLAPGDILALYTDGVVEATNATQQEFGEAGLLQTLRKNRHSDARSIAESVVASVQEFSAGEQKDDLTLLVARVR